MRGLHVLDAPVVGGVTAARRTAHCQSSCKAISEDYETRRPVFEAMGTNINYHDRQERQHAKMVNQDSQIAGTMPVSGGGIRACQKKET